MVLSPLGFIYLGKHSYQNKTITWGNAYMMIITLAHMTNRCVKLPSGIDESNLSMNWDKTNWLYTLIDVM